MMLGITLPAAVGLAILAQPILALLFEWGRFDAAQVARTAPILAIYSCSIPFYALISFLTRIFHSRQEMKAPVQVSAVALVFNVAFSIGLMIPFGVKGLASATVITSLSQFIFLTMLLARRGWLGRLSILWSPIARTILASTLLAGIVLTAKTVVPIPWEATRLTLIIHLTLYISTGIITYGLAMLALRMGSFFVRPQVS